VPAVVKEEMFPWQHRGLCWKEMGLFSAMDLCGWPYLQIIFRSFFHNGDVSICTMLSRILPSAFVHDYFHAQV